MPGKHHSNRSHSSNRSHRAPISKPISKPAHHILLTGSRKGGAYSGFVALSDRLQENAFLSGISPILAPGLLVGDYLIICSDYTGTAHDPYVVAGPSPVPVLGNMTMAPLFFQIYAALKSGVPSESSALPRTVTATATDGTVITLHTPEGLSGTNGGRALLSVTPQNPASFGTYIYRLVRITNVPANLEVAYSGDIYELGVTVSDALLQTWKGA